MRICHVNIFLLSLGLAVWLAVFICGQYIRILDLPDEEAVEIIRSGPVCPFTVDEADSRKDLVAYDKKCDLAGLWKKAGVLLRQLDPGEVLRIVGEQISLTHLTEELFLQKQFWVAFACAGLIDAVVFFFAFRPMHKNRDEDETNELLKAEHERDSAILKKYCVERLIILSHVIVRSSTSKKRQEMILAGQLQPAGFTSDVSMFAVWFVLQYSIEGLVITALNRIELCRTFGLPITEKRQYLARIGVAVFCCACASSLMMSVAAASFSMIHLFYALALSFEALRILQQSSFALGKLLTYLFKEPKEAAVKKMELINAMIGHVLSGVSYAIYVFIGVYISGKILPLVLIPQFTHHAQRVFQSLDLLLNQKYLLCISNHSRSKFCKQKNQKSK